MWSAYRWQRPRDARLEDQVPETHLLRLIDQHISFAFVREKLTFFSTHAIQGQQTLGDIANSTTFIG
jgi:hypothetical protein